MENTDKELQRLKDGIEDALNNLQARYDEVLKKQEEIKEKIDSLSFLDLKRGLNTAEYNQLSLDAYGNGGELQTLSFAIDEIKRLKDENK
ncbi:hypothetical protein FKN04_22455 [Bacillus glycinifermentans]|uniref:hypothetical protein n=1 Tax=Bacillus glycinifermentans TaxID=1664069 RepID=UPI001583944C|nr:hypothetical protein [Bacillus glycinifermentans]NUJ19298.1 hypothetical protein [Bacillus glycinifermentans]